MKDECCSAKKYRRFKKFFSAKKKKRKDRRFGLLAEMSEPVIGKEDAEFSTQFFKVTHFVF